METKYDSLGEFREKLSKMLMFKRRSRATGAGSTDFRLYDELDGESSPVQKYWSARRSASPVPRDVKQPDPPVESHSVPFSGSISDRLAHVSPGVRDAKPPLVEPAASLETVPLEATTPIVNEVELSSAESIIAGPSLSTHLRKRDSERMQPRQVDVRTVRRKHSLMHISPAPRSETQKPEPKIVTVAVKKPLYPLTESKQPYNGGEVDHLGAIRGLLTHARTSETLVGVRKSKSSSLSNRSSLQEDTERLGSLQTEDPLRKDPIVTKDFVLTQSYQHIPAASKPRENPPVPKVRRSATGSASEVNSELSQWIANARKDLETILSN